MYKWYQVLVQDLDDKLNENLYKDLDENLAWLTQKTEDPKSNKGNLTFPPHTINVIELNCKILNNPPTFSDPFPLSSKSILPSRDSIFERFYTPFN